MKTTSISVTQAARNFADCINRVHYQNATFVLLKNGAPFARLSPSHQKKCRGRDLAAILLGTHLSSAEATAWRHDLKAARKKLKRQADKWR
ncbi:MAG TPA: hypothetical protein VMG59_08400 [Phycisphaerae bacterium]|nr:hypothetical protein [Phycisphaerae bacterium]